MNLLILTSILSSMCGCYGFFLGGQTTVTIKTSVGEIVGKIDTVTFDGKSYDVTKFLGIPYGEPPVGQNRFKRSVAKARFTSPYSAFDYGASCLQGQGPGTFRLNVSEDCLFLNIFMPGRGPRSDAKLPVMFWIHGGGFTSGTSTLYPGEVLSVFGEVIVVTINYRVAEMGFLRTKERYGNFGLWDQHLALRWINDNIDSFGGDLNNITIFGESAGGSSVVYQSLFPGNKGLFQRAIAESGGITSSWAFSTVEDADEIFRSFTKNIGCTAGSHIVIMECLRNKSSDEVATIMTSLNAFSPDAHPNLGQDFAPMYPQHMVDPLKAPQASRDILYNIDFMMGSTSIDGALFLPYIAHEINTTSREHFRISRSVYEKQFIPSTLQGIFKDTKNISQAAIDLVILEYTNWTVPEDDIARNRRLVDMRTHCSMNAPMIATAGLHSEGSNRNTYIYRFSIAPTEHLLYTPSWLREPTNANHADDLLFVFGFPRGMLKFLEIDPNQPYQVSGEDIRAAKTVMTMWSNFAKTGDPNKPGAIPTHWPQYNMTSQTYLDISPTITASSVKQRIAAREMQLWLHVLPSLI